MEPAIFLFIVCYWNWDKLQQDESFGIQNTGVSFRATLLLSKVRWRGGGLSIIILVRGVPPHSPTPGLTSDQRMPFSTPFFRPVASWLLVRFQTLNVFNTEGVWEGRQLAKISFRFVLRDHNNSLMGIYILCVLAYSQMRQMQHSDALTFTIIYVYTYVKYCNPKMILH